MKVLFGIDIGGTNIKIGLFKENDELLYKTSIKTNQDSTVDNIFLDIKGAVKQILVKFNYEEKDVIGYGFGLPGPVKNNIVVRCPNLGWSKTDLIYYFNKYFQFGQMISANDANIAAYGEYKVLKEKDNIVFITLGTGVGGGIIIGGKIIEGEDGSAGEVGHIKVDYENPGLCSCGLYGCLETVAGINGFKAVGVKLLKDYQGDTKLTESLMNPIEIFKEYNNGDLLAVQIVKEITSYIAQTIAKVALVVDPTTIIIGGGIANAGEPLILNINRAYQKYSHYATKQTKIILASLLNDAGIYGAYYLIKDKLIEEGLL